MAESSPVAQGTPTYITIERLWKLKQPCLQPRPSFFVAALARTGICKVGWRRLSVT